MRDCNYLVGVRLQGSGDQLKVGVAAVDTSLNVIQVIIVNRAGEPEPGVVNVGSLEPEPLEKNRSRSRLEKESGAGAA